MAEQTETDKIWQRLVAAEERIEILENAANDSIHDSLRHARYKAEKRKAAAKK